MGLEQIVSHPIKGPGDFRDFVSPMGRQPITEVSFSQGSNSSHQILQWASEGVGNQKHQRTSPHDGNHS